MQINSQSVRDTLKLGRLIAQVLGPGDIVCLSGQLGAGKTVLTKGIALGLGIAQEKIISPSFVLIRQYQGRKFPLYHFDLYRLAGPEDILALGYEEYFYADGITVIEWAQRLNSFLPEDCLSISFSLGKNKKRILKLSANGRHYQDVLKKIHENISH